LATNSIGGGMHNRAGSDPTVTDCNFTGNSASQAGGMFNDSSSPAMTNCTFSSNSATGIGGGMYNFNNSSPTVTNCTFSGNSAGTDGGGMDNRVGSDPNVTNCTFSNNSATGNGGGIDNYQSSPTVTNCILWGNTAPTGSQIYGGSPTVNYSDVEGESVYPGTENINADPCFVDAAGGDLQLSTPNSPCVDAGDNSVPGLPATDLAGNPRVADGDGDGNSVVDMGAYEYPAAVAATGRAVDFRDYCVIAAYWLDAPWPPSTDAAILSVPAMQKPDVDHFSELSAYRPATPGGFRARL
jgi:parallel beta-helix repeat protein